jgi:AbrB family looped-hinge helix DNA binding protein
MTLVTVCRAVQITLPCEIREVAHLVEGDYLEAEMTREGILLCPAQIGRNERSPEQEAEILAVVSAGGHGRDAVLLFGQDPLPPVHGDHA